MTTEQTRDPYAQLLGIEIKPTGKTVAAVCTAGHAGGGAHALLVGLEGPTDLGDLAHSAAVHRAEEHGDSLCSCPPRPELDAVSARVDPGCTVHGRFAQALETEQRHEWMIRALWRELGGSGEGEGLDDREVHRAALDVIRAARVLAKEASGQCRFHGETPPERSFGGGCESCREPGMVRRLRDALVAFDGVRLIDGEAGR